MQGWKSLFKNSLQHAVKGDVFWKPFLESMLQDQAPFGIHLAVLLEPYLKYILEGRKTVESRFSERRIAPYGDVHRHDVILLKRSGGPILGLCQVSNIWYYQLDPESWREIRAEFSQMLCAENPEFWSQRRGAEFATLMSLRNVLKIQPIKYSKNDRRGWVVLKRNEEQRHDINYNLFRGKDR
jgi:hypothetical protein